eukprot:TRINITY_DN17682_c0_g1_i1.p1 TRINITY_DN17682_c0_g1~~TRINITY_DN17682_c0_g1_i1.p1  ORF type:complete len:629 (-),score=141.38 TRINITY_DN17682_c0_g1_i1:50-1846(-)
MAPLAVRGTASGGLQRLLSKDELYAANFPWTIVDGHVYSIGSFLQGHPGGRLIYRAIGEDSSALFHTHHTSERAKAVLASFEIGTLAGDSRAASDANRRLQRLFNERIGDLAKKPRRPLAEAVAIFTLLLFGAWAYACYVKGCWWLNVSLAWFWWRNLDAGLHSAVHGDFRHTAWLQRLLLQVYSVLSHHVLEYYGGDAALKGLGMSKHYWHHVHTNDPRRDPDWETMTSEPAWVRRHTSVRWQPYHAWQAWYWIPVPATLESFGELLNMAKTCADAVARFLEPPCDAWPFSRRLRDFASLALEVLINPGYQGVAFIFQPWPQALGTLVLARGVSRIVLFPFAEVQHYMPAHVDASEALYGSRAEADGEEWVMKQLRTTANLRFDSWLGQLMDFLMFHGDSFQIEHHLWPAMSFVNLRRASQIVQDTCAELNLPYHNIGYWEGYSKILQQVLEHSQERPPAERREPSQGVPEASVSQVDTPLESTTTKSGSPQCSRGDAEAAAQTRKRPRSPAAEASSSRPSDSEESAGPQPRRLRRRRRCRQQRGSGESSDESSSEVGPAPAAALQLGATPRSFRSGSRSRGDISSSDDDVCFAESE